MRLAKTIQVAEWVEENVQGNRDDVYQALLEGSIDMNEGDVNSKRSIIFLMRL